jgi:mono/diheme cytochrome c family protein
MKRILALSAGAVVVALVLWMYMSRGGPHRDAVTQGSGGGGAIVAVTMPALSGDAALGARAFKGKCAACHGDDAGGRFGKGPPLIHKTYHPGHHGDQAFFRAARQGTQQHHWPFGNMPPVEGITDADIKVIIAYVRAVQKANGIF